jgi:hypothetical protein
MKNSELWDQYITYTKDVTEYARKLGFGGAALCWAFKQADDRFPSLILYALLQLVVYFVLDILQSFVSATLLKGWIHKQEEISLREKNSLDVNYLKPRWLDYPAYTFFILKTIILMSGFVFIGIYLVKKNIE